jgi:hypothetical protein
MRWTAFVMLRTGDLAGAERAAAEAETYASDAHDDAEAALARIAALRILAYSGQAEDAAERLAYVALVTPVTHPMIGLMARRFYAEALYLTGNTARADILALAVSSDARSLGLAREGDAVVNLLRFFGRAEALEMLPLEQRTVSRDRLDDKLLLSSAFSLD